MEWLIPAEYPRLVAGYVWLGVGLVRVFPEKKKSSHLMNTKSPQTIETSFCFSFSVVVEVKKIWLVTFLCACKLKFYVLTVYSYYVVQIWFPGDSTYQDSNDFGESLFAQSYTSFSESWGLLTASAGEPVR